MNHKNMMFQSGLLPAVALLTGFLFLAGGCKKKQDDRLGNFYSIEDIPAPEGVFSEVGGLDILPNGNLVACFHRGQVMIHDVTTGKWPLFASGLHDPLGIMAVTDTHRLVTQRAEVVRLSVTGWDGKDAHTQPSTEYTWWDETYIHVG